LPGVPRRGELGRVVIGGNRNSPGWDRRDPTDATGNPSSQFHGFRRRRRVIGAVSAR
jgi:hypothetical protein